MARRQGAAAWGLALALYLAGLGAHFALSGWLESFPFLTFFPALVITALICDWPQAALVLVLSTLAAWFFFLPPYYSFVVVGVDNLVRLVGFVLLGTFNVALISALARMIRRLQAATRIQDNLFRELQHRVANNMQTVAATLETARRRVHDPAALEILDQAAERIVAMAHLHRRLHDSAAYAKGLQPILQDALRETFRGLRVDIRLDVRQAGLSIDQMTAILLFVNEAAINAAKHVFRSDRGTLFEVTLTRPADGILRLTVRDDGPGIGPAGGPGGGEVVALGMGIMREFATQLGGSLRVLEGPGTTLSVDFAAA